MIVSILVYQTSDVCRGESPLGRPPRHTTDTERGLQMPENGRKHVTILGCATLAGVNTNYRVVCAHTHTHALVDSIPSPRQGWHTSGTLHRKWENQGLRGFSEGRWCAGGRTPKGDSPRHTTAEIGRWAA